MAFTTEQIEQGRATKRANAEAREAKAFEADGYDVRPDTPPGVGWRLTALDGRGPVWYLGSKEAAVASIPRHRRAYAGPMYDPRRLA